MNVRYLRLLLFHLFVSLVYTSVFANAPFSYDPYTLKIYNEPGSLSESPKYPYAVACPAETEEEEKVNTFESLDHKALFVRQFYSETAQPKINVGCKKQFELAVAHGRRRGTIEFGYEIYFRWKYSPEPDVYTDNYTNYGPISEARSLLKEIANDVILRPTYPSLGWDSKVLTFTWIPKITMRYNTSKWSMISTKYTIYRNRVPELNIKCDDYTLGHKFYKSKHGPIDGFYSEENQKKIFGTVQLPELAKDSVCKTTLKCVKKYDFLKPYLFRPSYSSRVSCSNLTTIPIWYEIVETLLNNLEMFLFAISQVAENHLIILPGVLDTIYFLSKSTRKPKPIPMYLYPKRKRIPIPRIIYKIIRYKSHNCQSTEELCWFDIVIVIHNHPGFVRKQMICPKDKCREFGWDIIKFTNGLKEGKGSECIYCCKLDERMQKILDFKVGKHLQDDLNLKEFPIYDVKLQDTRYVDRQNVIEDEMKLLQNQMLQILKMKMNM